MTRTVHAVYERGHLRLEEPVQIEEGARVEITISFETPAPERSSAAILAEIASLPIEGKGEVSGKDLDRYLHGKQES